MRASGKYSPVLHFNRDIIKDQIDLIHFISLKDDLLNVLL